MTHPFSFDSSDPSALSTPLWNTELWKYSALEHSGEDLRCVVGRVVAACEAEAKRSEAVGQPLRPVSSVRSRSRRGFPLPRSGPANSAVEVLSGVACTAMVLAIVMLFFGQLHAG